MVRVSLMRCRRGGWAAHRSGRSMLMADMDNDGDLDVVVNNVHAAAQYFENDLCTEGSTLEFALEMPNVQNCNAIGAQITLKTSAGTLTRDVRVSSAYLTAEPPLVHFGLAPGMIVHSATVRWPKQAAALHAARPCAQQFRHCYTHEIAAIKSQ